MNKTPLDLHISKRLRTIRIMSGVNQSELSELIGITPQQIQKYENGSDRMYASRLYEIAQILGSPVANFFEGYVDDEYYNFKFKDEETQLRESEAKNKELSDLIKSFNQISNHEIRKNIINLVHSIMDKSSKS